MKTIVNIREDSANMCRIYVAVAGASPLTTNYKSACCCCCCCCCCCWSSCGPSAASWALNCCSCCRHIDCLHRIAGCAPWKRLAAAHALETAAATAPNSSLSSGAAASKVLGSGGVAMQSPRQEGREFAEILRTFARDALALPRDVI